MAWITNEWLPYVPEGTKFLKMLHSPHEGYTYCVHLIVQDEGEIQTFNEQHLYKLQQHIGTTHNEKVFLFDSIMEYLS
jgi:hypothetical protein